MNKSYTEGFHWLNKGTEEWGVVKSLIESMGKNNEKLYFSLTPYNPDPPDCIAKDTNGKQVGFEVTALVDPEEIKENVKGNAVYRDWTEEEIIQTIQKKLNEKDRKIFDGGPYSKKIVVLHTKNPIIEQELTETINNHLFEPLNQLGDAYILFWYNAAIKSYPYLKLKFKEKL